MSIEGDVIKVIGDGAERLLVIANTFQGTTNLDLWAEHVKVTKRRPYLIGDRVHVMGARAVAEIKGISDEFVWLWFDKGLEPCTYPLSSIEDIAE